MGGRPTPEVTMRHGRSMLRSALSLAAVVWVATSAAAQMIYRYHGPEASGDDRYGYFWNLLKTALDRTTPRFEPYRLERADQAMNEARQAIALSDGTLTVMLYDGGVRPESRFLPVRIPLDKGLLGYRVFLIRRDRQPEFSRIRTLDDLRKLSVGTGLGWTDTAIWRANGFRVVEGSSYEGLFRMLVAGRFDFVSRSVAEALDECARRSADLPDLQIEQSLCVHVRMPWYFYFPSTGTGKRLAARVEAGLRLMIDDGSLEARFQEKYRPVLAKVNLAGRRVLELDNPLLTPETPPDGSPLWFRPASLAGAR
jgi:hypothetical protein